MNDRTPTIALFALGGTIASVPTKPGQDAVPTLTAEAITAAVPMIEGVATIRATTFSQTASGDLSMLVLHRLAQAIKEAFATGVDGVVVTQGTDTLEESSYLLDVLLEETKPVVLTGAMRNSGLAGPDGPANLLAAVQVAASPAAVGLGPLVVFADQIHLARYVRKTHSAFIDTFRSPNLGPIGWITEGEVHIPVVPSRRTTPILLTEAQAAKPAGVALIKVGLDDGLEVLGTIDTLGYQAVVLEAMGGGHLPSRDVAHVAALAARIPVIFVTRTGSGQVYKSTYGFPGSEKDLLERGLISGGALDGSKARLLVQAMLTAGSGREEIRRRLASEAM